MLYQYYYIHFICIVGPFGTRLTPRLNRVHRGETAIFQCNAKQISRWSFQNNTLPKNSFVFNHSTLVIKKVSLKNAGIYYCFNNNGDIYDYGLLQVLG